MKTVSKILFLLTVLSIIIGTFASCSFVEGIMNATKPDETVSDFYDEETVYAQALALGYTGTLEEFIALISGKDGQDGKNGKDGVSITGSVIDENHHLIFIMSNGTTLDAGKLPSTGSSGSSEENNGRFKVTFDYGDGVTETVYSTNYRIESPATPKKDGYSFVYWYINDSVYGHTAWSFDSFAVTKDMTLYAYWYAHNTPVDPEPVEVVAYDGSPVTLRFYHTMGQYLRDVLDDAIQDFNEIYPNITIDHSQVGNYDDVRDQIKNEIVVGNQPNIAYCYK